MINIEKALKELETLHITMKKANKYNKNIFNKMEYKVLCLISKSINITMNDIAKELNITKPRVTAIINALIHKGLIELKVFETDKRKKCVLLSEKGNNHLEIMQKDYYNYFKLIWEQFTEEEQLQWLHLTNKTSKIIENIITNRKG